MTDKTTAALKLAEEALNAILTHMGMDEDEWTKPTFNQAREALAAIREALANQSIVLNDPHPPHRLCECTACLEYWTPLPDCDAFAGGGKPIDHIADTGKMVGCAYCDTNLLAGSECSNCGRVTIAEPANTRSTSEYSEHVKQEPVACQFPRQPNNEGGWTIDAKFLNILVKDMADDEFAVGMEETEAVLLALERSYAEPVQPVKQEPVNQKAVGCYYGTADHIGHVVRIDVEIPIGTLLYAAPVSAKREWVELTVSDLDAIIEKHYDDEMDLKAMILDGIASFKEKNK